jgi:hypothetical protein
MSYLIEDYNQVLIYITDGFRSYYVPKFRLSMVVDEPFLKLEWNYREQGGNNRKLTLDYRDVESYGYDVATSAQDLKDIIDEMILSGWTNIQVGDLLNAAGQLITHDGISDTILQPGANESILSRDNSEPTKLKWIAKSAVAGVKYVAIPVSASSFASPAQNATYYFGGNPSRAPQNAITREQQLCPVTGTITAVYLQGTWGNSPSGNNHTFNVRVNNSTDALITSTQPISGASPVLITNASMSQAVTAGDLLAIKWATPATWATPVTNIIWNGFIVIATN